MLFMAKPELFYRPITTKPPFVGDIQPTIASGLLPSSRRRYMHCVFHVIIENMVRVLCICHAHVCTVCDNHVRYRIGFQPDSADAITDHCQSANDVVQYFKSKLYTWRTPAAESRYYRFRKGRINQESTTKINSAVSDIRIHKHLVDSPVSYH